jgi:hypothetical protein
MVHAASGEGSGVCVRAFCVVGAEAGPVVPLTNGFSMAAATERILVHNGKLMDNCNTTPKQLIEDCPGGMPYTTHQLLLPFRSYKKTLVLRFVFLFFVLTPRAPLPR